jgi:hypothetical protein
MLEVRDVFHGPEESTFVVTITNSGRDGFTVDGYFEICYLDETPSQANLLAQNGLS